MPFLKWRKYKNRQSLTSVHFMGSRHERHFQQHNGIAPETLCPNHQAKVWLKLYVLFYKRKEFQLWMLSFWDLHLSTRFKYFLNTIKICKYHVVFGYIHFNRYTFSLYLSVYNIKIRYWALEIFFLIIQIYMWI